MSTDIEVVRDRPRPLMDWFNTEFPDVFRWWDERLGGIGSPERIKVEEEVVDGMLHIRAEVPGIDPDKDAEISVQDGMLRIQVERRQETKAEDGKFRTEFRYGSMARVLPLPKGATAQDVAAHYHDGILEVTVPVPASEEAPRKVAIARS
ncbi:MAG: Hsp20/alpha crystallin family protein [Acidimicrobiia bacterium]|nr:Hsp20/alpha crystallin family protein [Acidimicrobiia bacterium]